MVLPRHERHLLPALWCAFTPLAPRTGNQWLFWSAQALYLECRRPFHSEFGEVQAENILLIQAGLPV